MEKFENDMNLLDEFKHRLKGYRAKKNEEHNELKTKIRENIYTELINKEAEQGRKQEEIEQLEYEKALKRREFLKQKRLEYDRMNRNKKL